MLPEVYVLILDPSSSFLTDAVLRLYHLGGTYANHQFIAARERSAKMFEQRKYEAVLERQKHDSEAKLAEVQLQVFAQGDIARDKASAARHRQILINTVLTLRCPHCLLAVLDFDGCFAVQHTGGCNKEFCGWCLLPFPGSGSCHTHVKQCPSRLFTYPFTSILTAYDAISK